MDPFSAKGNSVTFEMAITTHVDGVEEIVCVGNEVYPDDNQESLAENDASTSPGDELETGVIGRDEDHRDWWWIWRHERRFC